MRNSRELLESLVIRDYLSGKTREQIALDNKTSTGNVSNITKEWKNKIGKLDAEQLREFVVLVKKSGLSMEQCVQGFRTAQLMKNLGIDYSDNEDEYNGHDDNQEFTTFVKEIYRNCKKLGVNPATIPKWIKDLFDCYYSIDNNNNINSFSFSIYNDEEEEEDTDNERYDEDEIKQEQQLPSIFMEPSNHRLNEKECENKIVNSNYCSDPNLPNKDTINLFYPNQSLSDNDVKIPFISQVSNFIAQKKKECNIIKANKIKLAKQVNRLIIQKNQTKDNIDKIIQKENYIMHYLNWFYKLKKELWDNYSNKIEDIFKFAKVFNDFKNHNYDPYKIIDEYTRLSSVREEIITKNNEVEILEQQVKSLNGKKGFLECRLNFLNLAMNTYDELEAMSLGLRELKQLRSLIVEISEANGISSDEAGSRFLKDIEQHYDTKLGFEKKINEMKSELEKIKKEIPDYRYNLQIQSLTEPVLSQLLQNGVTREDIINMNLLVTNFANNNFYFDSQSESTINRDQTKVIERVVYWKTFINKLKELGNINSAIIDQIEKLNQIEKQVIDSKHQKQELDIQYKNTVHLLNYINTQISYLIGLLSHAYKDINKNINASLRSSILFINLIYVNSSDKDNKAEEEQNK